MTTARLRLCLVGSHGAGKSTLCALLAERLRLPYRPEIGRALREAALAADPGRHALNFDAAFDRAVLEAELARDVAEGGQRGFVVETWHPGNLAYAQVRSTAVFAALWAPVRRAARASGVLVVPVVADTETLRARCNEPGGTLAERTAFFEQIGRNAVGLAAALGLSVLPAIDTSRRTPERCVEDILAHVAQASAARRPRRFPSPPPAALSHRSPAQEIP